MLILLPPSETKTDGGTGAPLDLTVLSWPELTDVRTDIAHAAARLSADPSTAASVLGTTKNAEIERNTRLWTSPTAPAIERYTGVLYDAFDHRSMTRAQRAKTRDRVAIGSALFGAVRAGDPIPTYRLSGGTRLPGRPTLAATWKPVLGPALAHADDLVVDLRSGVYQQLGPVPGAITATVVTEKSDGSRGVVSHFNKHHKGVAARSLVVTRRNPRDIAAVAAVIADGGQRVEIAGERELVVVTD
ncbi:peroxide stress protein YaaA [Williamsia sterculiae]|uniref:peroxide stress protein YaaA n=1 Tax=Williamsia sterculiae TaxID=1344003 RepID=UPI000970352F|nr:peroxide stress protein YaaA [Williamsia sterculiae]